MSVNCLTAGGQNVATDVKGNITTLPANLRPAGATTAMNLTWDSDNKLRSADIDANGTADVNFQYDALGRRVARSGTGGSVVFVQMDQQTIADYPVGGAASTPTFRYVYASYIDEPVVRKGATSTSTAHFFHRNHQYSVTAITTSTGAIAERYAYTAYGQPTILDASASVLSSSAINNRYTYTGREWDATLALYHFRARWMSPSAGRFLTRDPIGFEGGDSLYAYVENKPLRWLDPKGTNPLTFARVVFSVLSIASSVNTIRKHLDDKNPASWPSPFANDYRIPSTFNFEGTPGGKGTNNTPCPCDGKSAVLMDERWCNAFACDTYKITVKFNYCEGGMSGHTIATGSNSMYRVAHVTETVNGHSYGLSNRCGCHKEIPCVNVDFVVRRFVDEPWPIWDWEEAPMVGFTACADGTLSVH